MKTVFLIAVVALMFGCGNLSKAKAGITGYDEVVVDGVVYIQFTSGVTVKYNQDGTICRSKK
jgi:hypothetical protein